MEAADLTYRPWMYPMASRRALVDLITGQTRGVFGIRHSRSYPGCFVLCVSEDGVAREYLIQFEQGLYAVEYSEDAFSSLPALVAFYSSPQGARDLGLVLRPDLQPESTLIRPVSEPDIPPMYREPHQRGASWGSWQQPQQNGLQPYMGPRSTTLPTAAPGSTTSMLGTWTQGHQQRQIEPTYVSAPPSAAWNTPSEDASESRVYEPPYGTSPTHARQGTLTSSGIVDTGRYEVLSRGHRHSAAGFGGEYGEYGEAASSSGFAPSGYAGSGFSGSTVAASTKSLKVVEDDEVGPYLATSLASLASPRAPLVQTVTTKRYIFELEPIDDHDNEGKGDGDDQESDAQRGRTDIVAVDTSDPEEEEEEDMYEEAREDALQENTGSSEEDQHEDEHQNQEQPTLLDASL